MKKDIEDVFEAKFCYPIEQKNSRQILEVSVFTEPNPQEFEKLSNFVRKVLVDNYMLGICGTLSKKAKDAIKYDTKLFEEPNFWKKTPKIVEKYWAKVNPELQSFQIYIGNNFEAIKPIVKYFGEFRENTIQTIRNRNKEQEKNSKQIER